MKTLHAITIATKKRSNQKKWEYQPTQYTLVDADSNPVPYEGIVDNKNKYTRTIYRNFPDSIAIEEFRSILQKMIVMTPFGVQCLEYDASDILKVYQESLTSNPPTPTSSYWSFIYHPKKSV